MPFLPFRPLLLAALTAAALLTTVPARAVGRLADVQVIDRDSGETLTVYRYRGEHWVAGRPGTRYAVSVRNASDGRVMAVVSVDGVNVVSGESAAWGQTGYVLSAWQQYNITGWRKSDAQVAAFHFTGLPDSYAARTGRPGNVGVIGIAVFREKPVPVQLPRSVPYSQDREADNLAHSEVPPAPASASPEASTGVPESAPAGRAERRMAPVSPAMRLGTGHGEREDDRVGHTSFERRSHLPDETIRIRYDSRENLIAMGIIASVPVSPRPNPFPQQGDPRYVPDPS